MAAEPQEFPGTIAYWERRYACGGDSGDGSFGKYARFKGEIVNRFVAEHDIRSVIEFGCGDGRQLRLARYPAYLGFDVSETAIEQCRRRFRNDPGKRFRLMRDCRDERADLALSLEVIFHLVEDQLFEAYMRTLFAAADRYVIIYSSNIDENPTPSPGHVRHRRFTTWVERHCGAWTLLQHIPGKYPYRGENRGGGFSDFFIYGKG